jgi:hypothetical protein
VEVEAFQVRVRQGEVDAPTGFVRLGDPVTLLSRQQLLHILIARDADFFSWAFPPSSRPCTRRPPRKGTVELSSGAGYFWMRAYLFVDDHPYYARTGPDGRFHLGGVPPGEYELVCWLPDWRVRERELDADTARVCRVTFHPPRERVRKVRVGPGQQVTATFGLSAGR